MTKAEIIRRLRKLVALPLKERPISVALLEELAALHKRAVYEIIETQAMSERTRIRLERALTWVENDQVRSPKMTLFKPGQKREVSIGEPKKPCLTISVVRFTRNGPQITQVAYNPNALQEREGQT